MYILLQKTVHFVLWYIKILLYTRTVVVNSMLVTHIMIILIYSDVHAQKSVAWLQEKQTKNGDFVIQCVISCKIAEFRK